MNDNKHSYGIDLIKIVSMLMIITLHILGAGLGSGKTAPLKYVSDAILIACYGAVNLFAMASGYVMHHRQFNPKNPINVWCITLFYTVILTVVFWIFFPNVVGLKEWIKAFLPITYRQYWYVTAYITMSVFIPLILPALEKLALKNLTIIVIMMLLFTSVLSLLNDFLYLNSGYSTLWILVMFVLGYFIARIREEGHYIKRKRFSLLAYAVCVGLTFVSKLILSGEIGNYLGVNSDLFVSYVSPLVVAASVFMFCFLVEFEIRKKPMQITLKTLSGLTLGVYLVHVNPLVWNHIWQGAFSAITNVNILLYIPIIIISVIGIFFVCALIDFGRVKLFALLRPTERILSFYKKITKF